jgi:hypothetical protein
VTKSSDSARKDAGNSTMRGSNMFRPSFVRESRSFTEKGGVYVFISMLIAVWIEKYQTKLLHCSDSFEGFAGVIFRLKAFSERVTNNEIRIDPESNKRLLMT